MDDNPYAAPTGGGEVFGVLSGQREDLTKVAFAQKGIIVCLLIYFCMLAGQFLLPPELRMVLVVGLAVLGITGMVFVFMLATRVYGVVLGVLLGILTLVPCLGLLVLLMVNQKATGILKQNGISVGLLGAKSTDL